MIDEILKCTDQLSVELGEKLDSLDLPNVGARILTLAAATTKIIAVVSSNTETERDTIINNYIDALKGFNHALVYDETVKDNASDNEQE